MEMKAASDEIIPTRWTKFKHKFKKTLRYIGFVLAIVLIVITYWKFYYTYSEGFKSGILLNFEHKGLMFKTYEGELMLVNNIPTKEANERFPFSVENKKVSNALDTLQGKLLLIHYKQKNTKLFWRGESVFMVDSIRVK